MVSGSIRPLLGFLSRSGPGRQHRREKGYQFMIARFFMFRRSLLLVGGTVAALAFPGAALAKLYSFHTSAVKKNHGFKVSISGFNTNSGYGAPNQTTFTVTLKRTSGHATQTAAYAFSSGAGAKNNPKLTGVKNLSKGKIKGTLTDGRGSVDMHFHATGKLTKASVPKGCSGTPGKKRSGTWSGKLTLKADKLGTVRVKSEKGSLSTAIYQCAPNVKGYLLEATHSEYYVTASKPSAKGSVREMIQVTKNGKGYGFTYTYAAANEPTTDYTLDTAKLSTAKVTGAGGIKGKASYKGSKSKSHSYGKLTGTMYVKMAAIGLVKPFASAKKHTISADQRR